MVAAMDRVVGALDEALHATGLWDDTLFIFSTDNGGPIQKATQASNYPMQGKL